MVKLSYDELYNYADIIVRGNATSVSHHRDICIYRIVTFEVEKYYKNPQNVSVINIRLNGGTIGNISHWVEDTAELPFNRTIILFLKEYNSTFGVLGGPQGVFTVNGDNTRSFEYDLEIKEETLVLRPPGNVYLYEFWPKFIPKAQDTNFFNIAFSNNGGQSDCRYFNFTFLGVYGPAQGKVETRIIRGCSPPEGYSYNGFEMRFSHAGEYHLYLDNEYYTNITVLDPDNIDKQYKFKNLNIDTHNATLGQTINIQFTVENGLNVYSNLTFSRIICPSNCTNANLSLNMSEIVDLHGYEMKIINNSVEPQSPGNYTVAIWHQGECVLQGNFTVETEGPSSKTQTNSDFNNLMILSLGITSVGLAILLFKRKGI